MIVLDRNGLILKVNPAVEQMFHYEEIELVGESITILFANQESNDHLKVILEAIKNLNNFLGYENFKEIIAARKDSSLFPAEIQIGKRYVGFNV